MWSALRRLLAYVRRNRLDDDLAEEIRLHLELREQALVDNGMAPAAADREARRQFGNVALIRERTRDQWGGSSIDMLIQDVRYGLRLIRKAPGLQRGRDRVAGGRHRRVDGPLQFCERLAVPAGSRRQSANR